MAREKISGVFYICSICSILVQSEPRQATGTLASVEGAVMATIEFQHVTRMYPDATKPAVDDVSFTVPEGVICMLVGTSGSGKTTLLRMVNRLIDPTQARYSLTVFPPPHRIPSRSVAASAM